jgi:hypothetical protein
MSRPSDDTRANPPAKPLEDDQGSSAKDAPISVDEVAKKPPTRQGGADAGRAADDPGRGAD